MRSLKNFNSITALSFMKFAPLVLLVAAVIFLQSCDPTTDVKIPKATHLYFSDYNGKRIGVVDLETPGSFTTIADASDGLDSLSGMAIDFKNGKIYIVEELTNKIKSLNLDGTGSPEILYDEADGVDMPTAIAVDGDKGDLYWANSGSGHLMKGDVTGTDAIDTLYSATKVVKYSYGLVIDTKNDLLYYSDLDSGGVWLGRLDGESYPGRRYSRSVNSTTLLNPSGLFLDRDNGRLFWADEGLDVISLGYTSGSPARPLFDHEDGIKRADGIAVDNGNSKVYWTETHKDVFTIFRGNLDGTEGREVVLEGVESYCIILKFDNQ